MPLIVLYTGRVRDALKRTETLGADLLLLGAVACFAGVVVMLAKQASTTFQHATVINLSVWSLPRYTLLSLGRGFAAYALSLIFTLVYGTIAAHNRRAEKVMVPALDVLQAIPVLGFLPGVVLAMVQLFPTREVGLEISCILMIFTAQVWNMTLSFHGSLRAVPPPLREVAAIHRLSGWQIFRILEVPSAMIGLVWNSMMSMAGGWFFLTVNEAFTLGDRDYRLPGIGSYMNEAINKGDGRAMFAAVIAMTIMIVLVDQVFWRPIVVWSQRFKMEDQSQADAPTSWALSLFQRARLYQWIGTLFRRRVPKAPAAATVPAPQSSEAAAPQPPQIIVAGGSGRRHNFSPLLRKVATWLVLAGLGVGAVWGAWALLRLLTALPLTGSGNADGYLQVSLALLASFARTSAAVIIGAVWALPVGIMIGRSPRWSQRLQPIIQVIASFPAPMLFPLVTLGLQALHVPFTVGCVALMLLGAQWYILFNVIAGASAMPQDLKEVASTYGMSRFEKWRRFYIPSVFPYLVTGLITAAGGAWNATIVSEYVQLKGGTYTAFGLGSMITRATMSRNFPLLAASVVFMAACVVLLNRFFWKRLYHLAEERYSLNA